jgi:hypothetical protein
MHSSRGYFDVSSIPEQTAKKAFRNRAAANVTGADKENVFHDSSSASERESQPRIEPVQVNLMRQTQLQAKTTAATND